MTEIKDHEDIVGFNTLAGKRSAVDGDSRWKMQPIDGLMMKPIRPA